MFPAKDVPFGGRDNIRLHLGGQIPKKSPQNGREWALHSQIDEVVKIAIYRSPMKIFASNFTQRLITGAILEKKYNIWSNGVIKGSRDLLLKFWDPLHISETVEARNFKFGMHIDHQGH